MSETISTIKAGRYDWTALAGVVLAALPDLITWLTTNPAAPTLPVWAVWGLRGVGLLLAAQGKPAVVVS